MSHRGQRLRQVPGPFVVAPPAGARVRTRLGVNGTDEVVLQALGTHLGRLASLDLAHRVAEGPLGAIDGANRSLGDNSTNRGPGPSTGRRRPPDGAIRAPRGGGSKTTVPTRSTGDQVAQDRSGPPGAQGSLLLTVEERCQEAVSV